MNLLKQTALILGLTSLSIGSWTIYHDWRNRISIFFTIFCAVIAVWSLSFVSHATLSGRLSHDIHLFCNVWLSPIAIMLLSKVFFKKPDVFSQALILVSSVGALFLGAMISLSIPRSDFVLHLMDFWPSFILFELISIMVADIAFKGSINTDYISTSKKPVFYIGLCVSLSFCTFDRVPEFGYTIPALGNLFLTVYLAFTSQLIIPQKIFRIEALLSRFFAVVILALMITGFFALLYDYISETFPLFLLNSFLISFAVLMLWNPLVTFFRYLVREGFGRTENEIQLSKLSRLTSAISVETSILHLQTLVSKAFNIWLKGSKAELIFDAKELELPPKVLSYFVYLEERKITPILHREMIRLERDQVLTAERRQVLNSLIQFLDNYETDLIFPVFFQKKITAMVLVKIDHLAEEWNLSLSRYAKLNALLAELGPTLVRLTQIEEAKERDRLVLMGEMAAGLAHEVRNPLGAIRGAAALMDETSGPWAKVIQEEVARLNRLVSQFLDFANDPKDQQESIDLNEVVSTAIQNIKISVPCANAIHLELSSSPVRVRVVPDHLQQVLLNLTQNAVKAVEGNASPEIRVQVFETGFEVKDNGVGMNEKTLNKIFQPFFTSFKDGTGLGLSICQKLVHFNSGKISATSKVGEGSTLRVTFNSEAGVPRER